MRSYAKFILLILCILVFINNNLSFRFKLRDADSDEDDDDSKGVSKSEVRDHDRDRDRSGLPQFKKIVKIIHVNDDGTETEEKLAINFEKVRKSDYQKPTESKRKRIVIEKLSETPVKHEETVEKTSFSLKSLFSIFGFGKEEMVSEKQDEEEEEEESLPPPPEPSSDETWFQSLIKRFSKPPEPKKPVDNWRIYLNRWPFNLLLDFLYYESSEGEQDGDDVRAKEADGKASPEKEPLSQDVFERLLHNLPNFLIRADDANSQECRRQVQIFHRQLRGHKLWTLHMLDSVGKIPSGILRGNIKQYGDFDQCVTIKTSVKITEDQSVKIRGKYCLAHIDVKVVSPDLKVPVHYLHGRNMLKSNLDNPVHFVPRYTVANLGICVPHGCTAHDAHHMFTSILTPYNSSGINFHVQITEDDCYVRRNQTISNLVSNNFKLQMTLSFYGFFVSLVICGTLIDVWPKIAEFSASSVANLLQLNEEGKEKTISGNETKEAEDAISPQPEATERTNGIYNTSSEVILSFSLPRNVRKLLNKDADEDILILDFLKVLSTFCIYAFLKFLMIGHLSIINRDKLVRVISHPFSTWVRAPLIYLDTFLVISGILSAYRIPEDIKTNFKTITFRRLGGKALRYIPLITAVLLFQIWIMPHLGSGPLWTNMIKYNSDVCSKNLWRNIFFTQNFVNMEEACSPLTIQYAVDFQLYLLAPLLVWLYYRDQDLGLIVFGSLQAVSVAMRFSRSSQDRLSAILFHGMNISQFYRASNALYASPIYRISPFLIGIATGVLLKNLDRKFTLPKGALAAGWVMSVWCFLWCFWYPSSGSQVDFIYNPGDAAVYASWAPLLLGFSLAWIVTVTHVHGLDSPFSSVFISKPIIFLGKISFPMQIVSYIAIFLITAQTKEPQQFSLSYLINPTEIIIIIFFATILSLVFDLPLQSIRKSVLVYKLEESTEAPDQTHDAETEGEEHEEQEVGHEKEEASAEDHIEEEDYDHDIQKNNIEQDQMRDLKEDMLIEDSKDDVLYFIPRRTIMNNNNFNEDSGFDWNEMEEHGDENWKTESDLDQRLSPEFEKIVEEPEEDEEDGEEGAGEEDLSQKYRGRYMF